MGYAFALVVWRVRSADIGTFIPAQSEPAQILEHRRDEHGPAARAVEVFIAQDECAARRFGALLGSPKRAGVAQVEVARGRWRKAAAIHGYSRVAD